LAPYLSRLSLEYDVPVYIYQTDIVEISSRRYLISTDRSYRNVYLFESTPRPIPKEAEGYCGLYREALNSNSPIYQFLCFFKIIEAVKQRRRQLAAELQNHPDKATLLRREGEIIPEDREYGGRNFLLSVFSTMNFLPLDDLALAQFFPEESLGKRFSAVIQKHLEPIRNKVAHALLDDTGDISVFVDEMIEVDQTRYWLPVTKCIARRMLQNEFPDVFGDK
jgi:hypothetical protein